MACVIGGPQPVFRNHRLHILFLTVPDTRRDLTKAVELGAVGPSQRKG